MLLTSLWDHCNILRQHLLNTWHSIENASRVTSIDQWCGRLNACVLDLRVNILNICYTLILLMKLAGSTWGASANNLWSSALALCYSAAEYCTPVWSCSAHTSQVDLQLNLACASSLVPFILHLSHGFQCSPTMNRQPYEGRLPMTSWWRKSSNMTVGQSSLISLTHHCYDW